MGTMTDNEKRIFWIDFMNDFLTIDRYAEYHNMDVDECTELLSEGKMLYNDGETAYSDGKELELIKYEAEKFADNITDRLTRLGLGNNLDYAKGSVLSHILDRLDLFIDELNDFNIDKAGVE